MKSYLILAFLGFAAFWGYAYANNPAGCKKIGQDYLVLVQSLIPGGDKIKIQPEEKEEPAPPPPPVASVTPTIVAPTYTPPVIKKWEAPFPLPAQPNWTWTTSMGATYKNVVIDKVEPDTVSITHSMGATGVPISTLPPELQKQLNYDPDMVTVMSSAIKGMLFNPDGSPWTSSTPIRYYAVYFSAHWCPPCRAFTPKLVEWYKTFKPLHPNFELIFVSVDEDAEHMADYQKSAGMTFPAVRFTDVAASGLDSRRTGRGIPNLMLFKDDGTILLNTYDHDQYLGPEQVMNGIAGVVR